MFCAFVCVGDLSAPGPAHSSPEQHHQLHTAEQRQRLPELPSAPVHPAHANSPFPDQQHTHTSRPAHTQTRPHRHGPARSARCCTVTPLTLTHVKHFSSCGDPKLQLAHCIHKHVEKIEAQILTQLAIKDLACGLGCYHGNRETHLHYIDVNVSLFCAGEQQVEVTMVTRGSQEDSSVGVLASVHTPQHTHANTHSADSWQSTVLLYNCRDNVTSNNSDTVTLNITGAPSHTGT